MGKLLNLLFIAAVIYFAYWMLKRHFRRRKLESMGYVVEQKGMRPITLFSIVMLACYGAYMVWFFTSGQS